MKKDKLSKEAQHLDCKINELAETQQGNSKGPIRGFLPVSW